MLRHRGGGDIPCRLDPERWDSPLDEVLQQVAVVTRQLDDEALEPSPSRSVISSVYRLACSTQLFE